VDAEQIQKIAKALADPRRREILEMIAESQEPSGIHCGALVERLPIAQPTVSHHIKELTNAGLIEVHSEAQFSHLTLRTDVLNDYLDSLRSSFHVPPPKNP
jgi:ArsR family transcriptional regulator